MQYCSNLLALYCFNYVLSYRLAKIMFRIGSPIWIGILFLYSLEKYYALIRQTSLYSQLPIVAIFQILAHKQRFIHYYISRNHNDSREYVMRHNTAYVLFYHVAGPISNAKITLNLINYSIIKRSLHIKLSCMKMNLSKKKENLPKCLKKGWQLMELHKFWVKKTGFPAKTDKFTCLIKVAWNHDACYANSRWFL